MDSHVEAGERAAADLPYPPASIPPGSMQPAIETRPALAPVNDELSPPAAARAAEDKLAVFYEPCPQGDDCAGDGKHRRLFDCDQGCGFRGCAACMELHESEPHASDSETALEMFRGVRSCARGDRS
jgi:hypothetical protein